MKDMKLSYKRTIFVGFAFFLICLFWQAYDTIIPKILTDKFGMSQTGSGFIMALDNILALFMLPLFGNISDKCKSKYGRRTPFIVVGTILSVILLFTLTFADAAQLKQVADVAPTNPDAQTILYDADLTIRTPAGKTVVVKEEFSREEFQAIPMTLHDGSANPEYASYVIPARQAYASTMTAANNKPLIFFIVVLLLLLIAMATFRSPAVALMPDVTLKPLRSKANSIINLMGALGGIVVLILGMVFGTGKSMNVLMSYRTYFLICCGIMLVALGLFLWQVREPKFVQEMQEKSAELGLDTEAEEDYEEIIREADEKAAEAGQEAPVRKKTLSADEKKSLYLILASVILWFLGYNAITSKYSVYASSVLGLDYAMTLTIASAAAIVAYIPAGIIASKIGRRKTILAGVVLLAASFLFASFMTAGSSPILMNIFFVTAGIGWATINVNSYPMVVELATGDEVGKYTGFYYTASMAAQTVTPIFSGFLMDHLGMRILFPYGALFVAAAFVTMMFVRHGDSVLLAPSKKKEA